VSIAGPARLIWIKARRGPMENDFADEEADMRFTNAIRGIFGQISAGIAARRRLADFTCGDCDRVYRCNLSPADSCIARHEQIARGDWKTERRARAFLRDSRLI
jgi:hypothetical protein